MWIAWTRWWCAELDSGPCPVTVGGFLMLLTMSMSHIQDVDWMFPNKLALVSPRRYPACSSQLSRGGRLFGYVACWFTFFLSNVIPKLPLSFKKHVTKIDVSGCFLGWHNEEWLGRRFLVDWYKPLFCAFHKHISSLLYHEGGNSRILLLASPHQLIGLECWIGALRSGWIYAEECRRENPTLWNKMSQ